MPFNFIAIARDVTILFVLVFFSNVLAVQFVKAMGVEASRDLIALSSLFWGIVGFTISGCLVKVSRWTHLTVVALVFWLVSAVNVVLGLIPITSWLTGSILVLIMMGMGGGLSYLFVKSPQEAEPPAVEQVSPPAEGSEEGKG